MWRVGDRSEVLGPGLAGPWLILALQPTPVTLEAVLGLTELVTCQGSLSCHLCHAWFCSELLPALVEAKAMVFECEDISQVTKGK